MRELKQSVAQTINIVVLFLDRDILRLVFYKINFKINFEPKSKLDFNLGIYTIFVFANNKNKWSLLFNASGMKPLNMLSRSES